mgnify:FL=1
MQLHKSSTSIYNAGRQITSNSMGNIIQQGISKTILFCTREAMNRRLPLLNDFTKYNGFSKWPILDDLTYQNRAVGV